MTCRGSKEGHSMSGCCAASSNVNQASDVCGRCGSKGQSVQRITLESLLNPAARARLREWEYFFDPSPECDVVYFSDQQDSFFMKDDLLVRVGIKEKTEQPIPICYCFGHTMESARQEILETGRSTVVARVKEETKAGNCACEVKNPSGRCCLGEVIKAVVAIMREQKFVLTPRG